MSNHYIEYLYTFVGGPHDGKSYAFDDEIDSGYILMNDIDRYKKISNEVFEYAPVHGNRNIDGTLIEECPEYPES